MSPLFLLGHGAHGGGIMEGLTHPIFGLDHFIAILGTGVLGYLLNPSKWYLPLLAFLGLMIIGGFLGISNEATFLLEKIIAFSVLAIGTAIAFKLRVGLIPVLVVVGIFGFCHGYAHGAEMSETNTALKYISGYSIGTLIASTLGMLLARLVNSQSQGEINCRILGGVIMGCGIMILMS